jgi:hypothetical protein
MNSLFLRHGSLIGCRLVAVVAALSVATVVHAQTKDPATLRKEGDKLFGPNKVQPGVKTSDAAVWSVVIESFHGDDKEEASRAGLQKLKAETSLTEAYLEQRGSAIVIAWGRFIDGSSKEAREGLQKVRDTEVIISNVKTKPFAAVFLAPPANIPGTMPEFDLRQAKKVNGEWVIYTLQIGVYTRREKPPTPAELAEFRKTAEQAVSTLRHEGEQAYYYHGPTGSMVTIGLFGKEDFDPQTPGVESPTLTLLRKRYPYNLYNGQAIREKIKVNTKNGKQAEAERMQPSALVVVPKGE